MIRETIAGRRLTGRDGISSLAGTPLSNIAFSNDVSEQVVGSRRSRPSASRQEAQ
jgi:hypothetical protein